jgi:glycosyltransferase involved in cell wall biosynthesis
MLMVSPAAPWPATTGGLVRIAAVMTQMARHFELTFVSPRRPDQPVPADLPIRFVCPPIGDASRARRALAYLDPSRPFHAAVYSRPEIARIVERELRERRYDVVYSHFIYGMEYLRGCRLPVVIDQQNVDRVYWRNKADHSPFPVNLFAAWNTRRTIQFERRALPGMWAYVSVSDEDREQTRAYAGGFARHFWVASNGVDTHRFRPAPDPPPPSRVITLGYLGSMDLQMNVEAVERFSTEFLPRIRKGLPGVEVRLLVIGREPAASVRKVAQAVPGITLSGTVDDVVPWLQRVDLLVSPLRIGAGTKLKVAEAMSCGLPVVGSSLAFAGLPGRSGEHYVRVDRDEDFVAAVCRLALEPDERAKMGGAARTLAEAHLEWDAIGDRLADDIETGLAQRGRRTDG